MSTISIGGETVAVEMSDGLSELANSILERVAPKTLEALRQSTDRLYQRARKEWPVGRERGRVHSRDLLYRMVRIQGTDRIVGVVGCTAKYTRFIRGRKQGGKSTMLEVLFKPGRVEARPLARRIASELVK